ncbi:UNVERIFIED_CONTAM: hypothetical protein FKN15_046329 [Acipenser sinensis]
MAGVNPREATAGAEPREVMATVESLQDSAAVVEPQAFATLPSAAVAVTAEECTLHRTKLQRDNTPPKPAVDLTMPTIWTSNQPTPLMNLERSRAKKMAVRKRTLRPLAISWDHDLDSNGEWIVQGMPTRDSKAVTYNKNLFVCKPKNVFNVNNSLHQPITTKKVVRTQSNSGR